MSADAGSRVDQYFVNSYTEVNVIIRYRLNLNPTLQVYAEKKLSAQVLTSYLNKNVC